MELYFLKSAACLAILMLFYKLLLEKENMHQLKRYYLLSAVPLSVAIPLITFRRDVEATPALAEPEVMLITNSISSEGLAAKLPFLLLGIYLIGVFFFAIRFVRNLRDLLQRIRRNPKVQDASTTNVLLQENLPPHTFWTYIFLNRQKFEKSEIPKEVLEHEQAHAMQMHSIDVLFVELLQTIFWFYPVVNLLKKAIKMNHEFLADQAVIKKGTDLAAYQKTLLSFSSSGLQIDLVNQISYSSIKKRFTIMKTQTSQKSFLLRTFLLGPLLLGLLYGFSTTKTVEIMENSNHQMIQEEVTPQMIEEYNELALHFKTYGLTRENVEGPAFRRMKYIYSLMSSEQKESAESFPPPPPPRAISEEGQGERKIDLPGDVPPPPPPPVPSIVEGAEVLPPPPPPIPDKIGEQIPPPPPPPTPVEGMKKWIEEGADFYLNGKRISGKKAVEIVRKNNGKNLSVEVDENSSGKIIRITKD